MAAPSHVIDLSTSGVIKEVVESADQIIGMDVIPNLFSLIAVDEVLLAGYTAPHEVREEPVELGTGMGGPGEAAATEYPGPKTEVAAIFLHENVGGDFRGAEKTMLRLVDGHGLV